MRPIICHVSVRDLFDTFVDVVTFNFYVTVCNNYMISAGHPVSNFEIVDAPVLPVLRRRAVIELGL
jgi:hypothetical protein